MANPFNSPGVKFLYSKTSHHATYNFNLDSQTLYRNVPRVPFEYYVNFKLNQTPATAAYVRDYFNTAEWQQVAPLVKTVEMPAFKIESNVMNQYNRKRISQTKINFEPVKVVFHDVMDGKTLKFWEMYYRYYFQDGNESGQNATTQPPSTSNKQSIEQFLSGINPAYNPNLANNMASIIKSFQTLTDTGADVPYDTVGNKQDTVNIISPDLHNHQFGFNLAQVGNQRYLINSLEIYQVHAGRFNQVVLVNPRISAFTHDVLSYAESGKTLEITMVFEYEYAYYITENMQLNNPDTGAGGQTNNDSTIDQYMHGDFLDFNANQFNLSIDYLESPNPTTSGNPSFPNIGLNSQSSLSDVTSAFATPQIPTFSSSSLGGTIDTAPTNYQVASTPEVSTRSFSSNAGSGSVPGYSTTTGITTTNTGPTIPGTPSFPGL